ncbi:MAG TPA: DUF2953 domain-containing protein [Bacillales bacterium]|nr:DUF2953 domain-containing protein [Bacillales bacterium]
MTWLVWTGIVLILLGLIIFSRVHIGIHYHHHEDDDLLTISFKMWGIRIYTYKVPVIAIDEESASLVLKQEEEKPASQKKNKVKLTKADIIKRIKLIQNLLAHIAGFNRIMKRFLAHIIVSQFQWSTKVGLGNAAWTGVATGTIWSIKGNIVSVLSHFMRMKADPVVKVVPLWQGSHSETDLSCMLSFRIGQAMRAGIQIVKLWKGRRSS